MAHVLATHWTNRFYMDIATNDLHLNSFSKTNSYSFGKGNSDKLNRFEIHTLEWIKTEQLFWNESPEKINRYEVIWIKKGKGVLQVDGKDHDFSDNIIYCVAPGHLRKWSTEGNVEGYYISFTPEFLWLSEGYSINSVWFEQYSGKLVMATNTISDEMGNELEAIIRKMKWEYSNYFNQKFDVLKGLLNILMIYFSRNLKEQRQQSLKTRETALVREFMNLLKKNFIKQKMVLEYADQLFVSPNYLNRTVKKMTGFTASHHIQQQIIMEAKRCVIHSNASMKEVAYGLGFDNLAHFSKFFSNNCGMSFTDFKKGILSPD